MTREEIVSHLVQIPIFNTLDTRQINVLASYVNWFSFDKDVILFHEGDEGDYFGFIASGSLEVLKESSHGKNVVIATLNEGRTLGEMAMADSFPRSATVRTKTEVTLLMLKRKSFDLLCEQHAAIGIIILRELARLLSLYLRRSSGILADHLEPHTS